MHRRTSCALVAASALVGCRSPTQIEVTVDTDVDCGIVTTTSFTSGELGSIESVPPTSETSSCSGGHIGSMVLVPSDKDDALVGFKVVTALNHKGVGYCASSAGAGDRDCIVARRALRYLPHTPLDVLVSMEVACEGVVCDPQSTCTKGGCVPATIVDPSQCAGAACGDGVLAPGDGGADATVSADGGGLDATVADGGASDAASDATIADGGPGDASAPPDVAAGDAAFEAGAFSPPADCDLGGTAPRAAWPQEGYCATHRNRAPYMATTSASVTVHGPYPVDGTPDTAPAVGSDGTLYIAGGTNTIQALHPDGSPKWRFTDDAGASSFYTMPTLAADGTLRAYDGTEGLDVYVVLDTGTGGLLARSTNAAIVGGGVARVSGGVEYIVNNDSVMLEARIDGGFVWSGPNADTQVVPAVAQDHTVLVTINGLLTAVLPSGSPRWSADAASDTFRWIAVAPNDDSVRAQTYDSNTLVSYALATHAQNWRVVFDSGAPGEINGFSIGDDGTSYVGTHTSGLVRVDPNGTRGAAFGTVCNPPVIDSAGNVVAYCDGNIVALSPDLQTTYWSVPVPSGPQGSTAFVWETPVIGPNGLVYFTLGITDLPDGGAAYGICVVGP